MFEEGGYLKWGFLLNHVSSLPHSPQSPTWKGHSQSSSDKYKSGLSQAATTWSNKESYAKTNFSSRWWRWY